VLLGLGSDLWRSLGDSTLSQGPAKVIAQFMSRWKVEIEDTEKAKTKETLCIAGLPEQASRLDDVSMELFSMQLWLRRFGFLNLIFLFPVPRPRLDQIRPLTTVT
jgi:hypothetical protein